jgi:hypothetical protein
VRVLLALALPLAFAAPAMAQEPVVGEPQVVTDQATETEAAPADAVTLEDDGSDITAVDDGTPAPEPAPDASGRRGDIHVLDATSTSSRPAAASTPAAAATPAAAGARARTLPFTGVNGGLLALVGLALLAAGAALRRQLAQTF